MERETTYRDNTAIWWTLGAIVVLLILWFAYRSLTNNAGIPNTGVDDSANSAATTSLNSYPAASGPMSVEDYLRQNINAIAPEQAPSGSWTITNLTARDGSGTITYTDGGRSYTADYTYTMDANGVPTVTAFIPRSKG